ncbi:UNVERIFIED_CONTAM: Deoxynucleoside triphosphate triphosphohydrolase SAMHD1 [Sesamum latifolium]|uniref:Deoxynucleoside triphosphate triphosphohydrolase SAMHD1 n=1 Tax=Sesamum latifolium TaxID=2727402 RepID=A0AAW2UWP4_9LAMI
MGAKYCEEELPSNNFALASTDDRRFTKHIHDNVHGNIYIDPLSLKFVDTEQFQRLRDLKQLGLLHDLGHGPFSHTFEREFLPRSHEEMSMKMIDHVVDEHNIDIDSESLTRVKEMIIASENGTSKNFKEKLFLYDIVANGRNGIDVDKFDYIVRDSRACGLGCNFEFQRVLETMRVIDDEICYRAKEYLTIHKLFATRADLHRMVYMHAKVKAVELMFVDAMTKANDVLCISSYIDEPAEYWKLDDTILKAIETSSSQDLKESRDLILRIRRRELYQFCNEFAVPKDKLEYFKNVTPQDIVCSQVEAVSEAFENFQLKTYGKKAQVHATPEKKKRKQLRGAIYWFHFTVLGDSMCFISPESRVLYMLLGYVNHVI